MKVYTVEEVAEILRVSVTTVKGYISSGKLIAANSGAIRVSEENLKKFLNGGE